MKTAIFSDIHANPVAFEKCLADAKEQGAEQFVCLGDIVGYGYDPASCIAMCKANDVACVMGNHDAGVVGKLRLSWFSETARAGVERQKKILSPEDKEWLSALPYQIRNKYGHWRVSFSHGTFSYPEEFEYIQDTLDASRDIWMMQCRNCDISFIGHTHYAEAYTEDVGGHMDCWFLRYAADLTINPNNYRQSIINVGSVGYPRNQKDSIYVIWDDGAQRIHYRSLPFDYKEYADNLKKSGVGIPFWIQSELDGKREVKW